MRKANILTTIQEERDQRFYSQNVLLPLHSKIKQYKIIAIDIETYNNNKNFLIGGVYDDRYRCFYDKISMMQYIDEHCAGKDVRIYATNLDFDFFGIYKGNYRMYEYKTIMRSGKLICCSNKEKKIYFADTINYTPTSVKNLGKMLGLNKLYFKKYIGKIPRTQAVWNKLKAYNCQDCLITKTFVEKFQETCNKLGCEMKLTIASTSLDLYRRKYMPHAIYKERNFNKIKNFIYDSYYGGRTEAISRGSLKKSYGISYSWYDFNSAYPYQMTKRFPLPSSYSIPTLYSEHNINTYFGVSKVKIKCPYMKFPLLPYRKGNKLLFPIGTFTGTYTHEELKRALELGYKIKRIYKQIIYRKSFYPFKKYINELYGLRMKYKSEDNEIYSIICKLLMNALYGKLGSRMLQDTTFYSFDPRNQPKEVKDGFQPTYLSDDVWEGYQIDELECNQNYVIPIIPSYVTSYQRIELHRKMIELDALYVDTDSILTIHKIKDNFDLGGLKLEKDVIEGIIVKPKYYFIRTKNERHSFNDLIKIKGNRNPSLNDFMNTLKGLGIKQERFLKIKESMRQKRRVNQVYKFKKYNSIIDDKRQWKKVFNPYVLETSKPLYIDE